MPTLLHRVKSKLAIRAHRRVRGVLDGEYASIAHGKSLEFDELRPYVPGDEIRDIDWKATARHGTPYTRLYVAMRKHLVTLVVDTGRNMAAIGPGGVPKRDTAILVAGIVGYLAFRHGDHVSLVCGDAGGVHHVPGAGTESHIEQLLNSIQRRTRADADQSDLDRLLGFVIRRSKRRSILVIVSDDEDLSAERLSALRRLHAQHEVLWVSVADADPTADWGSSEVRDIADDVAISEYIRRDRAVRRAFATRSASAQTETEDVLEGIGVSSVRVTGPDDAVSGVFRLLERHNRARR